MNLKTGILLATGLFLTIEPASQAQHTRASASGAASPRPAAAPTVVARPQTPNLGGRPFVYRSTVAPPTGLIAPAASYTGIAPGALSSGGTRGRRNTFGLGYGGFYGVPIMPYFDSGGYPTGYPSYSDQAEGMDAQSDAQMRQDALAQQLDQMNAQIAQLRDSQIQGSQLPGSQPHPGPYAAPQWAAPTASSAQQQPPQAPIILILQNGAKTSVSNYAVMGGVIWDFSKQPARKIQISSVNVAASEKANEEDGGEFPQLAVPH